MVLAGMGSLTTRAKHSLITSSFSMSEEASSLLPLYGWLWVLYHFEKLYLEVECLISVYYMPRFWLAIVLCMHVLICRVCNNFWNFIQWAWLLVSFFSWKQLPEFQSLSKKRKGRKNIFFSCLKRWFIRMKSESPKKQNRTFSKLDSSFGWYFWPVP